MNHNKDLSYFNLSKVDRRLGYEISRSVDNEGKVHISFYICPYEDLVIQQSLEVMVLVPSDYHLLGGLTAKIADDGFIRYLGNKVNEHGLLSVPGLDEKTKYPFTVWFYAIREIFKIPLQKKSCVTSTLLDPQFKILDADWPLFSTFTGNNEIIMYCGSGRTRGKRNYMEDVDLVFESIKINDKRFVSVFGVLDGHGGKDCAQFCADDIPVKVAANMRNGFSCCEALYRSFLDADTEFLESDVGGNSGSTANIAVYDWLYNVFYIANTGDTRAVLCRRQQSNNNNSNNNNNKSNNKELGYNDNVTSQLSSLPTLSSSSSTGHAYDLSYDRKGGDPEEVARIARAGGFVTNGRVMGSLAVSRALGDLQLKEQGNMKLQRVLIPDPELSCFYPTENDEFILIATDGLWDVMTSQAAVDFTRNLLLQENLLGIHYIQLLILPITISYILHILQYCC